MAVAANVRKGGSWLLEETAPAAVFTPEKLSDEHRLMAQTVEEFVASEVLPKIDQLETKDWNLARDLVHRAGDLGLLGISVPEQYGGLDLDKVSALVVS
jgi:alkylation response protein AidB-like acyl-CoA dehydrogenase